MRMVGRYVVMAAGLTMASLFAPAAAAEPPALACAPLETVAKNLADRYQETPVARGTAVDGLLVIFASPGGATWTMIGIDAGAGHSACVLGSGEGWQFATPTPPGEPL